MNASPVAVASLVGLVACAGNPPPADMASLVRSLNLDPPVELDVDCPPLPADAERAMFAAVFANSPPVRPGESGFPSDYCPPETRFAARAEGRGNSTVLGEFAWSERYCTVPPGSLVAEGFFEDADGDSLEWDAQILPDSIPPPVPFATFTGTMTFAGGTGKYAGATGEAVLTAKQLGDAAPGRPAGSTATVLCGWTKVSPR